MVFFIVCEVTTFYTTDLKFMGKELANMVFFIYCEVTTFYTIAQTRQDSPAWRAERFALSFFSLGISPCQISVFNFQS